MKIVQETAESLTVKSNGIVLAGVFVAGFIVFGGMAIVRYFSQPGSIHGESFQGAAGAALVGLIGFLAVFERSTFVFDRAGRVVRWHRRRALKKRSGVVAFADIQAVVAQRPIADDAVPSRRVALRLAGQEELPLSIGYDSDGDGSCLKLAESIRQFIGLPAQDDLMASVRTAVSGGNVIEAVRLLRDGRELSLTQAKQMVDSMRESAAGEKEKM